MAKNDLHVALDVLARRPFDGMVILDAAEADALQQLIVDMHAAHERTEYRLSLRDTMVRVLAGAVDAIGRASDLQYKMLKGRRT